MSDAESESENVLRDNVTTIETELAQPALTASQRSRVRIIENSRSCCANPMKKAQMAYKVKQILPIYVLAESTKFPVRTPGI